MTKRRIGIVGFGHLGKNFYELTMKFFNIFETAKNNFFVFFITMTKFIFLLH